MYRIALAYPLLCTVGPTPYNICWPSHGEHYQALLFVNTCSLNFSCKAHIEDPAVTQRIFTLADIGPELDPCAVCTGGSGEREFMAVASKNPMWPV